MLQISMVIHWAAMAVPLPSIELRGRSCRTGVTQAFYGSFLTGAGTLLMELVQDA